MQDIPLNKSAAAAVLMEEADYDVEQAKRLARVRFADPVYAELREVLWRDAIDAAIEAEWREGRYVRKREAMNPTTVATNRPAAHRPLLKGEMSTPNRQIQAARERHVAGLMAFEMPNGTRLVDWTRLNLRDHGRRVKGVGLQTLHTANFFLSVADMLSKDDAKVGDELTETDLQRLFRQQAAIPA